MATALNLTGLFTELNRAAQNGDYDKGQKVANKILAEDPGNLKATHCKIVCLLKSGNFDEALATIENTDPILQKEVVFERAYSLYRLNRIKEALQLLQSIKDGDFRVRELIAQSLYRLEQYEECYEIYLDLIKNSADEYEDERETNLAAVLACLSLGESKALDSIPELGDQMYELSYNKACIEVGLKNHAEALKKLTAAEDMCRKTLKEEDATEEEIDAELGIIRAQIGYVYQVLGKNDVALRHYNQVLKQKPDDAALLAVTSNNIVTINKEQNVFDSKKKMRAALSDAVETKLSTAQKKTIAINNCLLLINTNQGDVARKQLIQLKSRFPEATAEALLLEASALAKEKRINEAIDILRKYKPSGSVDQSLEVVLALTQLLLSQGQLGEACKNLQELKSPTAMKLGIISALVALYVKLGDRDSVINTLQDAINWHKKNKSLNSDLMSLYRETARFLVNSKKPKEAIKLLEELRKANPSNPRVIAQLISAYSQFDPKKASEVMKDLPPIETEIASVDVEAFETSNWSLGAKYVKKITKSDPSPAPGKDVEKKKAKKRKRKQILPKFYNPNVKPDPERWLPRWQRSTFKKKKDKRGAQSDRIGKGTQGAVAGDPGETFTNPSPKPGSSNQAKDSPQGPRQQRPGQKKQKKKSGKK